MTKALTLDEAAAELRKTPRWLRDWLVENPVDETGIPFYVPMGRSKTFEPSDIARILQQVYDVCGDNAGDGCDHRMALSFVRQVAGDGFEKATKNIRCKGRMAPSDSNGVLKSKEDRNSDA